MSWIERAKVGDKVVCIDDFIGEQEPLDGYILVIGLDGLTKGEVYTIKSIGFDEAYSVPVVEVEEITRRFLNDHPLNNYFGAFRFKPARDTTNQVEELKRLCLKSPEAVG